MERVARDGFERQAFQRRACEIAERVGLLLPYMKGDIWAVYEVADHFHSLSAYYGLPENEKPVTARQLASLITQVLEALYGGKKR